MVFLSCVVDLEPIMIISRRGGNATSIIVLGSGLFVNECRGSLETSIWRLQRHVYVCVRM